MRVNIRDILFMFRPFCFKS